MWDLFDNLSFGMIFAVMFMDMEFVTYIYWIIGIISLILLFLGFILSNYYLKLYYVFIFCLIIYRTCLKFLHFDLSYMYKSKFTYILELFLIVSLILGVIFLAL